MNCSISLQLCNDIRRTEMKTGLETACYWRSSKNRDMYCMIMSRSEEIQQTSRGCFDFEKTLCQSSVWCAVCAAIFSARLCQPRPAHPSQSEEKELNSSKLVNPPTRPHPPHPPALIFILHLMGSQSIIQWAEGSSNIFDQLIKCWFVLPNHSKYHHNCPSFFICLKRCG